MKFPIYFLFLAMLLLFGVPIGESEMEANALIEFLNYSKTLIQNGELKYLYSKQKFIPPEKVGVRHRERIADLERQLRENPPKSENPEPLRKAILLELEQRKRYGAFEDSIFSFAEVNLVYQFQYGYRMEVTSRFEKFPSLGSIRYFGGDGQFYRFFNSSKLYIKGTLPGHFENERVLGSIIGEELENLEKGFRGFTVGMAVNNLPPLIWPPISTDKTLTKVHLTEDESGIPVYVITTQEDAEHKLKIYVRVRNGLPEVFREEIHFKYDSPFSDPEGYRLFSVRLYSDFERVEALNIAVPKVIEEQLFSLREKEFLRRRIVVQIKEMDFNLELPVDFFDWNEADLANDDNGRKAILGDF